MLRATILCCLLAASLPAAEKPSDVRFYTLEKEYRKLETVSFTPEKADALELKLIITDMLSIYGSVYVNEKNNTLYVTDTPEMIPGLKKTIESLDTGGITAGGNLASKVVLMQHSKAADIIPLLSHKLSADGNLYELGGQNGLVITDIPSKIAAMESLITHVDLPVPHIAIEIGIAEMNLEKLEEHGINLAGLLDAIELDGFMGTSKRAKFAANNGSDRIDVIDSDEERDFTQRLVSGSMRVSDIVKAITDGGRGKVLATTRLVTGNNMPAYLYSSEIIPHDFSDNANYRYQTNDNYVRAGVNVDVTPVIQRDSTISLKINPRISDLTGWSPKGRPIIFERSMDTEVSVKNGATYVIGGLRKTETVNRFTGVPVLKDIPVLRYLFGYKRKVELTREVVIFIKPLLLAGSSPLSGEQQDLLQGMQKK